MSRKKIPVKTREGAQEIAARALGLAPRIRTALLLVDGVKSVTELERLMKAAGVTDGALQLLLEKGLIRFPEESANSLPAAAKETEFVPDTPKQDAESAKEMDSVKEADSAKETDSTNSGLEVVDLPELESILGAATILEMETIVGAATLLELTPTLMLAPNTAVKAPVTEPIRLPPLAQAEFDYRATVPTVRAKIVPAAVLQMNLTVARAHIASAIDLFLEIDGYSIKQKVVACESRAELEEMFRMVEGALVQKIDQSAATRVMGIARSLLDR